MATTALLAILMPLNVLECHEKQGLEQMQHCMAFKSHNLTNHYLHVSVNWPCLLHLFPHLYLEFSIHMWMHAVREAI